MNVLSDRIARHQSEFTDAYRRIADQLLGHAQEAPFWGIEVLAARAEVSVATAVRFAKLLGFAGFLEMRQSLVAEARARQKGEGNLHQVPAGAAATLVEVARRDAANIDRLTSLVGEALLAQAVKRLATAKHRVVLGRGISQHMAELLAYLLTLAGHPSIAGNAAEFATQASNLGPKDLLVLFSFPPYSAETLEVAAFAMKRGVPVMGFSDRMDAPLATYAEPLLPIPGENLLYSHSIAAFGVLAHALATALAAKDRAGALKRLREADKVSRAQYVD
jgi:DNA-binding MurR/RpiR family transcriptional regulator